MPHLTSLPRTFVGVVRLAQVYARARARSLSLCLFFSLCLCLSLCLSLFICLSLSFRLFSSPLSVSLSLSAPPSLSPSSLSLSVCLSRSRSLSFSLSLSASHVFYLLPVCPSSGRQKRAERCRQLRSVLTGLRTPMNCLHLSGLFCLWLLLKSSVCNSL